MSTRDDWSRDLRTGRQAGKLLTVADFAYEPCHAKRRINVDELARIT